MSACQHRLSTTIWPAAAVVGEPANRDVPSRDDGASGRRSADPGAGPGRWLFWQRHANLAGGLAARLDAPHIGRDALGNDETPGFATQVAAAVEVAGRRWVFDGAPVTQRRWCMQSPLVGARSSV